MTQDLSWRLLGPLRAGWSTCAVGVPDEPNVFYFGGADGGAWKTTDAGTTWQPISDKAPFSSVGALAIAPGNPRQIYAGSGQVHARYDIMDGSGVYVTNDEGRTWRPLGLKGTRHIGSILVDPRDSNVLLVGALGHVFGAHPERGVFRSDDGGLTWNRVLFVNETTGAVDLARDPARPDVVYAALWELNLKPWLSYFQPEIGKSSGIWKSTDAGKTWIETSRNGLPAMMGRIGLGVASGTDGQRVYAAIDASNGGLYRTDNGGASWQQMSTDTSLAGSYMNRITTDPKNADVLYIMGQSLRRSVDGGKTISIIKGSPGGDDYHFYWINPENPNYSILASDQGTTITVNGGKSWTPWYNQATGQFYRLAADNRFPYRVYAGQQDNGSVSITTRSDYGQITFRDWHPVGADERDHNIPDPQDPNIVFGSGLGGKLSRWDARTGRVANVSPWPVSSYAARPHTVKYRYSWITPIAISRLAPFAIYQGAQVLFRSTNKGRSWDIISQDLTGQDPNAKNCEGDVPISRATECGYGTIYSIGSSPITNGLVWIGTDNGRVMLTRDDGKTWSNVTPQGVTDWSRIVSVEPSAHDPATAYIAANRERLDDHRPYAYRTHDYGKTWTSITAGMRDDSAVNVVRHDPERAGLLFAGMRQGVLVSFDEGNNWESLQLNLPTSGINDLLVHQKDLVAATQGRALWILDDITPLRHMPANNPAPALVPPAPAIRVSQNENRDTPLPPEFPTTPNPTTGVTIDYFLAKDSFTKLEILNASGEVIRTFQSNDSPRRPSSTRYFSEFWLHPPVMLPAHMGHNRFVWDLRHTRPTAPEYEYSIGAVPGRDTPLLPQGIQVLPGQYTARLTVDGATFSQPIVVLPDPRVDYNREDLESQVNFYNEVAGKLADVTRTRQSLMKNDPQLESEEGTRITEIVSALTSLLEDLEGSDGPPTAKQRALLKEITQQKHAPDR